jgi:hypothetical protein
VDQTLTDRYAAPPAWRRQVTIAAVAVLALAGLAWLGWAAYHEATPKVSSQLVTFRIEGQHAVGAELDVSLSSGASSATCTVEAVAEDHSIVGELHFRPVDGANRVTVRTTRMATSVDAPGCTAKGQDEPR